MSKCPYIGILSTLAHPRSGRFGRTPKLIEHGHGHKKHKRHRTHGAVPNGVSSPVPTQVTNYWQYEQLPASP